jgi:hypothetical protein
MGIIPKVKLPTALKTEYIKCKICHRKKVVYIFDSTLKDAENDGMWKMVCRNCGFIHLPSKVKLQICMRSAQEMKQLGL